MTPRARFLAEAAKAGLPAGPGPSAPVEPEEIAALPEPARRYLRFMGVVGRPRDWSCRVGFEGRFRIKPDQRFRNCAVWQYTSGLAVARLVHLRMRYGFVFPVVGRDSYRDGAGRMLIRLFDLVTIEDEHGDAYDAGGLVAYLNDAVLLAPSLLLVPEVAWSAADGESFDLALTDRGRTVSARMLVDAHGAPRDFSSSDRSCYDPDAPDELARARWTTLVASWREVQGRPVPTHIEAMWHLAAGRFTYAELHIVPETLAFNVAPGA
ncbi:MAG TPA: DUF6544 family protein [Stellaceae bacterium]|nr:DUF6544 family protein [Stellaceae bacterium]